MIDKASDHSNLDQLAAASTHKEKHISLLTGFMYAIAFFLAVLWIGWTLAFITERAMRRATAVSMADVAHAARAYYTSNQQNTEKECAADAIECWPREMDDLKAFLDRFRAAELDQDDGLYAYWGESIDLAPTSDHLDIHIRFVEFDDGLAMLDFLGKGAILGRTGQDTWELTFRVPKP